MEVDSMLSNSLVLQPIPDSQLELELRELKEQCAALGQQVVELKETCNQLTKEIAVLKEGGNI